jgi:CheY-like chemotaxis protein
MPSKILLVDDEPYILFLAKKTLISAGYEVLTAGNGLEALQKLKAETIDLLLTDCNMPELDGPDLIKVIRDIPPRRREEHIQKYFNNSSK